MSVQNDRSHPLFIPEENRKVARERVRGYNALISGYMQAKDSIPTGFNRTETIQAQKKKILALLGADDNDWNNWQWQLKHAIRNTEMLSKFIPLSDEEREGIGKTATQYRWSISPYYASLMDPEDRDCPIRKQAIPSLLEYQDTEEMKDPYAVVYNSPAPLITQLYADRLIINVTNICAMFCRHCLRKKDIAHKDMVYTREDVSQALAYIAESPDVRDVLITGGDALTLSDTYLDWILSELEKIPHIEIMRLGSRMPVTLPQRITSELCEMLSKHNPVYLNTQFNHPKEVTHESKSAIDRLIKAGVLVGNQSVLLRGINNDVHVMKKLVHELLRIRVRPYYIFNCKKLQGIRHFRASIADGLNIMENLRGYTSGLAVPTYIVTAPEGKGKTPLAPTYLLNINRNGKVLFRTWSGHVCEYEDEIPCEDEPGDA